MQRLIIVGRRTDRNIYDFLRRTYADDPRVAVMIDRRISYDRRRQLRDDISRNQRKVNRRARWEIDEEIRLHGHAIVEWP